MNLGNPIVDLSYVYYDCVSKFSEYEVEIVDWTEYRLQLREDSSASKQNFSKIVKSKPTSYHVEVFSMFPQVWSSTNCGFGGIGGQAMTPAYTIIMKCNATNEYVIYINSKFVGLVKTPNSLFF